MSNPYDISSGYLAARQMKNDEARLGMLKPYYEAEADKAKENTRGLRLSNDLKGMKTDFIRGLMDKRKGGLGFKSGSVDLSGVSNGEYMLGVKSPDEFKVDYGITPKSPAVTPSPDDATLAQNFQEAEQYADGTPGGLGLKMPSTAQVSQPVASQDAAPAGPHPNSIASANSSAFNALQENDPVKAENLASNIFGASPKEFQKMIGDFAFIDWADDKITSKGLMDQVNAVKKMQAEGLGSAMQYALAGNYEKAIAKFDESGDVRGESISKIEKYTIKNPVAGAVKGTKDTYDGVKITHKDGTVDFLDPRRLLAETVSLKEVIDNEYRFGHSIRSTDSDVYRTDAMNESNKVGRETNAMAKLQHEQGLASQRLNTAFGGLRDDMLKELANTTGQSDMLTNPDKYREASTQIQGRLAAGHQLGTLNIMLGGTMTADPQTLIQYAEGAKNPDFFSSGNKSLERTPDGKQIAGFRINGNTYARTVDGVLIPYAGKPKQ